MNTRTVLRRQSGDQIGRVTPGANSSNFILGRREMLRLAILSPKQNQFPTFVIAIQAADLKSIGNTIRLYSSFIFASLPRKACLSASTISAWDREA